MLFSILTTYHERFAQWNRSLARLCELYSHRNDVEVCMVVDWKSQKEWDALEKLVESCRMPIKMEMADEGREDIFSPASYINQAARMANGAFYVLQTPEIFYSVDVLTGFDAELKKNPDAYVIAACEAMGPDGKHQMWYQHSVHRDKRYNFCSALAASNFHAAGGFDEDYSAGVGYDDDDFLARVRKLGLPEVVRDDLHTVHQFHRKPYERMSKRRELVARNRDLYTQKWGRELPI